MYRKDMKQTSTTFQLTPPDDHQRNLAEKEIQTRKYHFIGVMSGTAAAFSSHLWYQTIKQAERQLLLLRHFNVKPNIATYAHVYGPHDYNTALLLPVRMETLVHDNPKRRVIFAEHCSKYLVLGTSFDHSGHGSCG